MDHFYVDDRNQALINEMKELVESKAINLIHAHSIAALKVAVQVSQETLVPVVATIHGKFYPPRILRGLLDRCPKVIAVSSPVVTWLARVIDYPLQQIALIPNGIDTEYFTPGAKWNKFRMELEVPKEEKLVVVVSRLAWEKTRVVEAAIQAVTDLQENSLCTWPSWVGEHTYPWCMPQPSWPMIVWIRILSRWLGRGWIRGCAIAPPMWSSVPPG